MFDIFLIYSSKSMKNILHALSARNGVSMNHIYNIALIEFFSELDGSSSPESTPRAGESPAPVNGRAC